VNLNHRVTASNVLLEKAIKAEGKTSTVDHRSTIWGLAELRRSVRQRTVERAIGKAVSC
jgi:hypothetical protein